MKYVEHKSEEQDALKEKGWFVTHVVPGIDGVEIACMTSPLPEIDDIGLHVWDGNSIVDDCKLCGQSYGHEVHA